MCQNTKKLTQNVNAWLNERNAKHSEGPKVSQQYDQKGNSKSHDLVTRVLSMQGQVLLKQQH